MVDRTDIDALLIGALYGELAPADEARLTAHLESHPADRTALDDMARIRAAIRSSRILAVQFEPPPAISTLLLQEASRRAPGVAVARPVEPESETWFQRFVRSFVAHPALAAAATVVLVASVAGGLYLRGDAQFAAPSAPLERADRADQAEKTRATQVAAVPAAPIAPAAQAPGAAPAGSAGSAGPAGVTAEVAADSDRNRAQLDQAAGGAPVLGQTAAAASHDDQLRKGDSGGGASRAKAIAKFEADKASDRPEAPARSLAPAPPSRSDASPPAKRAAEIAERKDVKSAKKLRGIELHSPELSPRELADEGQGQAKAPAPTQGDRRAIPPPPPAFSGASNQIAAAPAAPPAAAPPADAKQARDPAVVDWARKQHDQVIALVASNRCRDAASAAVEIYNRAPDYYAANIATDRQIKPCMAYVNHERELADRSRGAPKNAADDMPAPVRAAPSKRK